MDLGYIGTIILLILGFGFVVFWHELGHFLAAKWAGVRVEQFAVGFGQAILSWRQGLGVVVGNTQRRVEQVVAAERKRLESEPDSSGELRTSRQSDDQLLQRLGIGETEYRLNWMPLGGYVKMLGQDDLKPGVTVADPRSYTSKPIGQRMVIVSAGVIMNVILAAILFMALFLMGFRAPPAVVGGIQIGSPAQHAVRADGALAPLQVGDRILYFDDKYQHDFTKITLATALAGEGQLPMLVRRTDGTEEHLYVTPARSGDAFGFLMLGVSLPPELKGPDPKLVSEEVHAALADAPVRPGEVIVAVEGEPVVAGDINKYDYWKLDRALQQSFGLPVEITVRTPEGRQETRHVQPTFGMTFGPMTPLRIGGMTPRAAVEAVLPDSAAEGKLESGDVIVRITTLPHKDTEINPTRERLMELLSTAGSNDRPVDITVLRDGEEILVTGMVPNRRIEGAGQKRRGLGIGLAFDVNNPVIADVSADSAAGRAGVPRHGRILTIGGEPVQTWYDVHRLLAQAGAGDAVQITVASARDGAEQTFTLDMGAADVQAVADVRYAHTLSLAERIEPRRTSNPLRAAAWGVTETRDLIIQFYLTIRRMVEGRVSPTNLMGPIGIVDAGTRIAYKGNDWLIWFLAMISANLAVVNFLPIPIVDGGLFVFLILEKIMGRPLSQQAQSIAQIVGLALILSVFLFVTYQDIARIF